MNHPDNLIQFPQVADGLSFLYNASCAKTPNPRIIQTAAVAAPSRIAQSCREVDEEQVQEHDPSQRER